MMIIHADGSVDMIEDNGSQYLDELRENVGKIELVTIGKQNAFLQVLQGSARRTDTSVLVVIDEDELEEEFSEPFV